LEHVTSTNAPLPQDPTRLRRKRIEAGLSQPNLAAKAGVSRSTVYRAEAGLCPTEAETLRRLAAALACEIADLMPIEPAQARS
jgi:transcriptional regulator with XRE-family HTH domain